MELLSRDRAIWSSCLHRLAAEGYFSSLIGPLMKCPEEWETATIRHMKFLKNRSSSTPQVASVRSVEGSVNIMNRYLIPGGRWLLAVAEDEHLYCWDLSLTTGSSPTVIGSGKKSDHKLSVSGLKVDFEHDGLVCTVVIHRQEL